MYEIYQRTLTIPAHILYDELGILSYSNYKQKCYNGKLNKLLVGGNGRKALLEYDSLPKWIKDCVKKAYGDPYKKDDINAFTSQLKNDTAAYLFFQNYRDENGKALLPEKIDQYYVESQILETYAVLVERLRLKQINGMGIKMGEAKEEICGVIRELKGLTNENSNQKKYPHNLPKNYRALDFRLAQYKESKYDSIIPKYRGNTNSKKIKGEVAEWLLAQYCLPHKPVVPMVHGQYNKIRLAKGWPTLSESAISKWLELTPQAKVWTLARHGLEAYRAKFGHKLRRDKNDWFPNCYWGIDGTKLDWVHYKDSSNGIGADIKIDVVFDVYSEKILGYSFSKTEAHGDHIKATKMAMNTAMRRPYLWTYDGQSGHTTKEMLQFYDDLVARNGGEHYKHAARQHGSPVEQLFSRFQQQVLNTKWFSDKQSIKSRKADSQPNMKFLMENRHQMKKWEDLEKAFEQCVAEWNAMEHPKFKETRDQVYNTHEQTMQDTVSLFEFIDMFWVSTKDPRNYDADGIRPVISGKEYHFEVYDADGNVDLDFRDKYTHCKFYTQYDPDQMDNYVRLYLKLPNGQRQYVADAQPKRLTKSIPAFMTPKDKAQMRKDLKVRDAELERTRNKLDEIRNNTGITPEKLIEDQELLMKIGGSLPKEMRNHIEADSFLNRL